MHLFPASNKGDIADCWKNQSKHALERLMAQHAKLHTALVKVH